ncbi:hypothetical protein STIAU_8643 [Stigmatella aurantiaca DW4/3-1]|uniref:Metal-binding motif-containing protein n=1 Tax=Stigmatella aurantiaca (strain DW4/3-1) TaxID=378806 RepID=Q09BE8_STIAD|nr:hypothetical protein STIAU_8643 [Stigmatella aurantiaca DW4/3-1]
MKLTVSYRGFRPGCIRILAQDADSMQAAEPKDLEPKPGVYDGALTVAVFRGQGWGSRMKIEAWAFEGACSGTAVAQQEQTTLVEDGRVQELSLALAARDVDRDGFVDTADKGSDCDDRDPAVYKNAPELCDAKDNDCDGKTEAVLQGQACEIAGGCPGGTWACESGKPLFCRTPSPTIWYRDADNDTFGSKAAVAESFCAPPGAGYADNNRDCDDADDRRFPGAVERCNGVDDNCNDTPDEGIPGIGDQCPSSGGCTGVLTCSSSGEFDCKVTPPPTLYYTDDDGDGDGRADQEGVPYCTSIPQGYVSSHTDCDDGNPFIHGDAPELCDAVDNDCDGATEPAGVCDGGTPSWALIPSLNSDNKDWNSISLWRDGGVWIVGDEGRRAVRPAGNAAFEPVKTTNCDGNWISVWAAPETGFAYIGADNQRGGGQPPTQDNCNTTAIEIDRIYGLMGLPSGDGFEVHGVGQDGTANRKTFVWTGTEVRFGSTNIDGTLYDIHGISRDRLFAVGGPPGSSRIYRFDASASQWQTTNIEDDFPDLRVLRGVWVVNGTLAYAVGERGAVLRWDDGRWEQVDFPTPTETLTAVLAFGRNSVYVTAESGKVYRYNGTGWTPYLSSETQPLNDIAGTSPEDIWVVGDKGRVFHWPRAP